MKVSDKEIADVFSPFIVTRFQEGDPRWRKIVEGVAGRMRRQRLRRQLLGWLPRFRRTQRGLVQSYSEQWSRITFEQQLASRKPLPFEWRDEGMLAYGAARKKLHLFLLARLLRELSPQSVLEVGSGNGFNLLLLAQQFPRITFTGIELTAGGVAAARAASNEACLPAIVSQFAAGPSVDKSAHGKIHLCQASAAALPFASKSFDAVFTILALEQMEEVREQALTEISRVARRHVLMIEPFRDWNATGHRRDYIVANDYFSAWLSDLPKFGLEPGFTLSDIPNKLNFRVGLVVADVD